MRGLLSGTHGHRVMREIRGWARGCACGRSMSRGLTLLTASLTLGSAGCAPRVDPGHPVERPVHPVRTTGAVEVAAEWSMEGDRLRTRLYLMLQAREGEVRWGPCAVGVRAYEDEERGRLAWVYRSRAEYVLCNDAEYTATFQPGGTHEIEGSFDLSISEFPLPLSARHFTLVVDLNGELQEIPARAAVDEQGPG